VSIFCRQEGSLVVKPARERALGASLPMSAERNRTSLSPAAITSHPMQQTPSNSRNPCFPVPTSSLQTRGRGAIQDTGLYIHHPCREHYALPKCTAMTVVVFKSCQHSPGLAWLLQSRYICIHTYTS